MGDYQLRYGQGQTRYMYLVMLAYSLLMSQLRQDRAKEWAAFLRPRKKINCRFWRGEDKVAKEGEADILLI
ncbi:MAG: hypothetical protein JW829_02605, partial [Pirellulales bacterium]|nr:hypothetical protein [Pirellulales bacterium]